MLELKRVKVDFYGNKSVLDINFEPGITLILGETGSLKTTILRVVGGIKEIEDGELILGGKNIEELSPKERNMSLVAAETLPTGGKTGRMLIRPLVMRGINKKEALIQAHTAAEKYALDLNKKIKDLTARERLSFVAARLMLRQTEVTMFDEPYHLFDDDRAVTDMIRSRGGYVLVTSCDGSDLEKLAPDYVVLLRRGEILQQGKTSEVLRSPKGKYVEMFLNI